MLFIQNEVLDIYTKDQDAINNSAILKQLLVNDVYDARIVVEWNNPDAQFQLQFVGPNNKYSLWEHTYESSQDKINNEKILGFTIQDFFLQNSEKGKWLLNINYFGNLDNTPTYFKVTIQKYFGTSSMFVKEKYYKIDQLNNVITLTDIVIN